LDGPGAATVAVGAPVAAGLRHPVEVLYGAADLAFASQLDQPRAHQLGHVVVDVAERDPELEAEFARGEGAATVHGKHFED